MPSQTADNSYLEKLKDPRWQKKRLEIFQRDEWRCQKCFDTTETLVVHHRLYLPNHEPWEYSNELLTTLCQSCHDEETHSMSSALQELNKEIKLKLFSCDVMNLLYGVFKFPITPNFHKVIWAFSWALAHPDTHDALLKKQSEWANMVDNKTVING